MEKVRLSLQSMLKSSEHFLQDDKVSPKSVHTTPGLCSLTSFFQLYTCRDKDSGYDFKTNTALKQIQHINQMPENLLYLNICRKVFFQNLLNSTDSK